MQEAILPSALSSQRVSPETVDAVSSYDLQRVLAAARALRKELTKLAEYLRLLAGPEEADRSLLFDMLKLAAAPMTKVHPVIEPKTRARVALVAAKLPNGYVLQSDFTAASLVRAKLLPACLAMQQRLVNLLSLRYPAEDVPAPRYR
jgi:hypothetical protein